MHVLDESRRVYLILGAARDPEAVSVEDGQTSHAAGAPDRHDHEAYVSRPQGILRLDQRRSGVKAHRELAFVKTGEPLEMIQLADFVVQESEPGQLLQSCPVLEIPR